MCKGVYTYIYIFKGVRCRSSCGGRQEGNAATEVCKGVYIYVKEHIHIYVKEYM